MALDENICVSIQTTPKFIRKGPANDTQNDNGVNKAFMSHLLYAQVVNMASKLACYSSYSVTVVINPSQYMMTSSNGNIFRGTGPIWREFTGHRWIPLTKVSNAEWHGALMFSLNWINSWVNNRESGDLRRHWAYYDVTVMLRNGFMVFAQKVKNPFTKESLTTRIIIAAAVQASLVVVQRIVVPVDSTDLNGWVPWTRVTGADHSCTANKRTGKYSYVH